MALQTLSNAYRTPIPLLTTSFGSKHFQRFVAQDGFCSREALLWSERSRSRLLLQQLRKQQQPVGQAMVMSHRPSMAGVWASLSGTLRRNADAVLVEYSLCSDLDCLITYTLKSGEFEPEVRLK